MFHHREKPMITLYHCVDARSFRPLWALEELGLAYQLELMPFPPRVRAKAYLDVNPLGTIPAMRDGETWMTESAAIVEYLAARHGAGTLGVRVEEADFGAYLNYLHFGEATLTFPQTLVLRYAMFEPPERRQPQVADDYRKWFLARLQGVERALQGKEWLCAGRFTGADISVGYALLLAARLRMKDEFPPAVADYWRRLQLREGFQKAKASQAKAATALGIGPTL
jgi:glutathione S-transferase